MADLCLSCIHKITCGVWAEKKCKTLKTRIYSNIETCKHYKKRSKDFKEPKCQCDDCLKRGADED